MLDGLSDGGTLPAEYGGWSTVSRLTMTPAVEDHGEIYACRATNTLLDEAVSDAVTLNVLCTPRRPPCLSSLSFVPFVCSLSLSLSLSLNKQASAIADKPRDALCCVRSVVNNGGRSV